MDAKIYWILPASKWNFTTVITLLYTLHYYNWSSGSLKLINMPIFFDPLQQICQTLTCRPTGWLSGSLSNSKTSRLVWTKDLEKFCGGNLYLLSIEFDFTSPSLRLIDFQIFNICHLLKKSLNGAHLWTSTVLYIHRCDRTTYRILFHLSGHDWVHHFFFEMSNFQILTMIFDVATESLTKQDIQPKVGNYMK